MFFFLLPFAEHDIHVSVCDIEIKSERIEITLKTFIDDLQIAVGLIPGEEIPANYSSADQMIQEYIEKSFAFSLGSDRAKLNISEISSSMDAVWITMVVQSDQNTSPIIRLKNSFLTEVYSDQTNVVSIKKGTKKKTYSLNRKNQNIEYDFE